MNRKFILLSLCLFIALIFTSACGSGGSSGDYEFYGYPTIEPTVEPTKDPMVLTLNKYHFTEMHRNAPKFMKWTPNLVLY